jgi:hypothetical protein
MYGIEIAPRDGHAVIYRFASIQSRDAWVLGGRSRLAVDTEEEVDSLDIGAWSKHEFDLPAGAVLAAAFWPRERLTAAG